MRWAELRLDAAGLAGMAFLTWPLCGSLFQCGCTWLWGGGHRDCNYYVPHALHTCPWCTHALVSGPVLTVLAITAVLVVPKLTTHHRPWRWCVSFVYLLGSWMTYVLLASGFGWYSLTAF